MHNPLVAPTNDFVFIAQLPSLGFIREQDLFVGQISHQLRVLDRPLPCSIQINAQCASSCLYLCIYVCMTKYWNIYVLYMNYKYDHIYWTPKQAEGLQDGPFHAQNTPNALRRIHPNKTEEVVHQRSSQGVFSYTTTDPQTLYFWWHT